MEKGGNDMKKIFAVFMLIGMLFIPAFSTSADLSDAQVAYYKFKKGIGDR